MFYNPFQDYKKAELVAKERRWVGTIVTKMFDGERYMGNVVDFDEETEYFKVGVRAHQNYIFTYIINIVLSLSSTSFIIYMQMHADCVRGF